MASRRALFSWVAGLCALPFLPRAQAADMPKPRLCVWASDRTRNNPSAPQRGDVVAVIDTMRHPGREVAAHPDWRVIDVDIQVDDPVRAMAWLTAADDAPEAFISWFRRHTLDLDAIERHEGILLAVDDVITVTPEVLWTNVRMKLALPDRRYIV